MPTPSSRRVAPLIRSPQGAGIRVVEQVEVRRLPGALELPVDQIRPDSQQPRRNWQHDHGEQRLADLVRSIEEFGVLLPILVGAETTDPDGVSFYPLIAGNRRLIAAERAGLQTIPALVRATNATNLRVLQLTENLQRQNLAPLDEAHAYKELMDLELLTAPALAQRLHVSENLVRNRLHLLDDQVLADAVERRQISATSARQILQLPDEERARFRDRVIAGERIQSNDLATSRARLRAEGVENPRRSPRPALPLPQVLSRPELVRPLGDHAGQTLPANPITSAAPPDEASPLPTAQPALSQASDPPEAQATLLLSDGLAELMNAADPSALVLLRQLVHFGEAGTLDLRVLPLAARLLGTLLRHGVAADLSCRALFDAIWTTSDE